MHIYFWAPFVFDMKFPGGWTDLFDPVHALGYSVYPALPERKCRTDSELNRSVILLGRVF